ETQELDHYDQHKRYLRRVTSRWKCRVSSQWKSTGIEELLSEEAQTNNERQSKSRAGKRAESLASIEQYDGFALKYWESLHNREEWRGDVVSWEDVVDALRRESEKVGKKKEYNAAWREGIYENGEFKQTKMIILDIDEMTVMPADISDWLKSLGLTHVIHHTNRMTASTPRVRVVVPMSHSVMDKEYKHILRVLKARAGTEMGAEAIAFDKHSHSIKVPMFVPNVSPHGADLFIEHTANLLDAVEWLKMTKGADDGKSEKKVKRANALRSFTSEIDPEAFVSKHAIMPGQSGGHGALFACGKDLHYGGRVPLDALETVLQPYVDAGWFGTSENRSVRSVVASLKNYKANKDIAL
ncbi:hypothetical protein, partial [Rhizobium sp. Leaf371]|uniref:hypothetical protein n=1 Tax=Rhizobium sp. Leaf371 TaxID=1736355 RepID=UPI000A6010A1